MTFDEAHVRIASILGPAIFHNCGADGCVCNEQEWQWLKDPAQPTGTRITLDRTYGVCDGNLYLFAQAPDGKCDGWDITDVTDPHRPRMTPEDGAKTALAFIEQHAKKEPR